VSILLGIGSLQPIHVPRWLSLFDSLRGLPGFRSLEVTGRYWGFLSVPVCLLAAGAVCRYLDERPRPARLPQVMALLLTLQLVVETQAFIGSWSAARRREPISTAALFRGSTQEVAFVMKGARLQGDLVAPTRGVLDCYDHDDFIRARIRPGAPVVEGPASVAGSFEGWSDVALQWTSSLPQSETHSVSRASLIVNQAWHPYWSADRCRTIHDGLNRLALDCSATEMRSGAARLHFEDPLSTIAARVSKVAWAVWIAVTGCLLLLQVCIHARDQAQRGGTLSRSDARW
jgi:hypothetical protein